MASGGAGHCRCCPSGLRLPPRILRRMVDMRQRQLETPLDMLGHKVAGQTGISLLEGVKNCVVDLIRFLKQFLVMAETFDAKNPRVNVAVAGKFRQSGIAGRLNDGHVKRKVGLQEFRQIFT